MGDEGFLARNIASFIYEQSSDGQMPLSILARDIDSNINGLLKYLQQFTELFYISKIPLNRDYQITVTTQLDLCQDHCSKQGCRNPTFCGSLHICKFYLLSNSCCRKASVCQYGHALNSPHNGGLLRYHFLDRLSEKGIRALFCRDRSHMTVPKICKFYNVKNGCRADGKKKKCSALHVCKFYVKGDCKFKPCKRSHSLLSPQPSSLLKSHGFNVHQSEQQLLEELREKMETSGSDTSSSSSYGASEAVAKMTMPVTGQTKDSAPDNICMFNLRGKCSYGNACKNVHHDKTYLWQYKYFDHGNRWINCDDVANDLLEKAYCDIKTKVKDVSFNASMSPVRVDLNDMNYRHQTGVYDVRRLSTESSVRNPSYRFTTVWQWWWQNEHRDWMLYGKEETPSGKTNVTSTEIETTYLDNPEGKVEISTDLFRYTIDFKAMTQQNKQTGTKRPLRRRPLPYDAEPVKSIAVGGARPKTYAELRKEKVEQDKSLTAFPLPIHWDTTGTSDNPFCQIVEIKQTDSEFKESAKLFLRTMPGSKIKQIKRIQNAELWEGYSRCKNWMERKGKNVNEQQLFHGTCNEYIDAICQQGFDCRISGSRVGKKFGCGSYFAKNASYSKDYTDSKVLFLVKVLVGKYTVGSSNMVRPPPIDATNSLGELYDSTVNNAQDPTIFVLYQREQSYPEYLIYYN